MKKKLVLFTINFPFSHSESFLETEILFLSKKFHSIDIIPLHARGSPRTLPKNAKIVLFNYSIADSLISLAKTMMNRDTWSDIITNGFYRFNLRKLKFLLGQYYKTERTYRKIKKMIQRVKTPRLKETLFYTYWFSTDTFALSKYARFHQPIDIISRAHGFDLYSERSPINDPLIRAMSVSNLKGLFAISENGNRYLRKKFPSNKEIISTYKLGVSDPGFVAAPSKSNDTAYIVSCSYMVDVKRIPLIIESLAHFANDHPETQLYWTHLGTGPLFHQMKRLSETQLPKNIHCQLLGQLTNKEVFNFYRDQPVDLLINLSSSEGLPVSMMEAQSCGIPILATSVGGVPEIVSEKTGGIVSKNPMSEEVAKKLHDLFKNREILLKMRDNARENWNKNYCAEKNYNAFMAKIQAISLEDRWCLPPVQALASSRGQSSRSPHSKKEKTTQSPKAAV